LLFARRDKLHRAFLVKLSRYAVYPPEAKQFVNKFQPIDELLWNGFLKANEPNPFGSAPV